MSRFISLFVGLILIAFAIWFYTRSDEPKEAAPAAATARKPPSTPAPQAPARWADLEALSKTQPSLAAVRAADLLRTDEAALSSADREALQEQLVDWLPSAIQERLAQGDRERAWQFWATLEALTQPDSPRRHETLEIWQQDLVQRWNERTDGSGVEEPGFILAEAEKLNLFQTSNDLVAAYQQLCLERYRAAERQEQTEAARWLTETATARLAEPGPLGELLQGDAWSVHDLEVAGNKLVASGHPALAQPFYEAALQQARRDSPRWGYTGRIAPDAIAARLKHNLARAWLETGYALQQAPKALRTTLNARQCFLKARAVQPADPELRAEIEAQLAVIPAHGA